MAFHVSAGFMLTIAPTVWVVDDDEDDRLFIQSAFEDTGKAIAVLTLNDGDQLLPSLADCKELPRLILMDINMIRQDGFETLAQLRNITAFAHLPVVMMTTSSSQNDYQRSLALGADQFLTKPATYKQLVGMAQGLADRWDLA